MNVFLHAPQHFNNLCVMARTLEALGVFRCFVYDPNRLIRKRYGKSYSRRLRTISAGAFFKMNWECVPDPSEFCGSHHGRTVATVAEPTAQSLFDFRFADTDLVVFGSEGRGLPPEIIASCAERITIPQRGVTQSLNLCVASGIVLAEWRRQQVVTSRELQAGGSASLSSNGRIA